MIKVYAPATCANITVGFDSLGLALSPINFSLLGDIVKVEEASNLNFSLIGEYANKLPNDINSNIIYKAYSLFAEKLLSHGKKAKKLHVSLQKNMPIGSGLGSSASSAVASLIAYNHIHNNPLSEQELLQMMGSIESMVSGSVHYDNVAPSYLGGLQLMSIDKVSVKLPIFENWYWVVAYPGININTLDARKVLPNEYDRATIIKQSRCFANFIHSLYTQNENLAIKSLQDFIAEPYRESLIPNFTNVKQKLIDSGALKVGISGSGPTLYAIANNLQVAQNLVTTYQDNYLQNNEGFVHICKVNTKGANLLDE